jgi:hypothetical protein
MANVNIEVAAEFTGKKAFKEAETAADKLSKQAKNLAGSLGLAFGTAQVIAFGKNAVKAFAENEKSAKRLEMVLKNIGLGFDTAAIEKNLGDISAKFGYEGEILRDAFQKLITVTGDTSKAQDLLKLSLDIAAGSGEDLLTVNQDLAAALVGNTKGLKKYNLGLTQSELSTLAFNDAVVLLTKTFAGAGEAELDTYTGKMRVLREAANSAAEEIGRGLLSAITSLAGSEDSLDPLIKKMNELSVATGDFIALLFGGKTKDGYSLKDAIDIVFGGGVKGFGNRSLSVLGQDTQRADAAAAAKAAAAANKREKERLALLNKQNAAKRLQGIIDKANLALGKGKDVFDLDKIQVAAALTNQAEQLGKATTSSQLLQITNDTARLNVKRSMLELEDAIAAKDEASIIAAQKKLEKDLGILGALINQDLKMKDIKTILESLKPKDLINLGNLDAAIAKMIELNRLQNAKAPATEAAAKAAEAAAKAVEASAQLIPKNTTDFTLNNPTIFKLIDKMLPSNSYNEQLVTALNAGADLPSAVRGSNYQARAEQEYAAFLSQINMGGIAGQSLTSGMAQGLPLSNALSGSRYAAQGAASYGAGATININTGVGDPEAIARAVEDVIRQANQRGTTSLSIG